MTATVLNPRSHTRTVVRECFKGDEACQWIRPKFNPSQQKPLNRSSSKLACVITSWTAHGVQNFEAIDFSVSARQYPILPNLWGDQFLFVFGFFNKATAYTPERIFTQNTSNDVVPGKEVLFGGLVDYIYNLDPHISEKPPFCGPILTGLGFFCGRKPL